MAKLREATKFDAIKHKYKKQALESVKLKQVASINTKDVSWKRQYLKNSSMKQSHQKKIMMKLLYVAQMFKEKNFLVF